MACGTPVIGFAVGGISDMVRDGLTGFLVQQRDVAALRIAIMDLLGNPSKRALMSEQSRRIAVEDYSRELQVRRYADLYKSLI